eukprot:scaffold217481_cov32-Tisochrysis_lutea.AAC.2
MEGVCRVGRLAACHQVCVEHLDAPRHANGQCCMLQTLRLLRWQGGGFGSRGPEVSRLPLTSCRRSLHQKAAHRFGRSQPAATFLSDDVALGEPLCGRAATVQHTSRLPWRPKAFMTKMKAGMERRLVALANASCNLPKCSSNASRARSALPTREHAMM